MCGWGVSFPRWGGGYCLSVGWARGRLPAGSGCRGLTVGGYSAASSWCVPWWSLVGWLQGVFGVYRIHGGTIVCWGAAAVGAAGCGGGACVGVDGVFGGGVSCVVLGGSSWWSVVVGVALCGGHSVRGSRRPLVAPGGGRSVWGTLRAGVAPCGGHSVWGSPSVSRSEREKFIVFSALRFCFSCCLLLL